MAEKRYILLLDLITPFQNDGKIDFDYLETKLDNIENKERIELHILGFAAEGYSLSLNEKIDIISVVLKQNFYKVIVSIFCYDTNSTLEFIEHVNHLPFDGYSLILPHLLCPSQEGVYEYIKTVAMATEKDIFIYYDQNRIKCQLSIFNILELSGRHKNIVGLIYSGNDLSLISILKQADPTFLFLIDEKCRFLPFLQRGADGILSLSAHLIYGDILEFLLDYSDDFINKSLQSFINLIIDLIHLEDGPAALKYILNMNNTTIHCRPPLGRIELNTKKKIDAILE